MPPTDERPEELVDVELREEIELVSDLVVAAASARRHFTQAEVDTLLGVGDPELHSETGQAIAST